MDPLKELAAEINRVAHAKGWYIYKRTFGEYVALFHSEITEAFEEVRNGHRVKDVYINDKSWPEPDAADWDEIDTVSSNGGKPEGVGIELADAVIRILDFAHEHQVDISRAIRAKMLYNETRPYRHGGKTL